MANDTATPPEEVVDAQVVEDPPTPGTAVAAAAPPPPPPALTGAGPAVVTLWNTDDPQEIVKKVTAIATALADVIKQQGLAKNLGGKKDHVEIEGWQTAGTLLGAQAMTVWTGRVEPKTSFPVKTTRKKWGPVDGKRVVVSEDVNEWTCEGWSYEAIAEVRTLDGRLIGRGEAICSREEKNWMTAEDSAVKGMAQTRAQSRALKQALGFIVGLAGYSSTPKEEMDAAGVTAPVTESSGPAFGRELKPKDKKVLLEHLTGLLTHDDPAAAKTAALQVIGQVKAQTGGDDYFPFIAAFALITAATKRVETDPATIAKKAADANQSAAEQPDTPSPESAGVDEPAVSTEPADTRTAEEKKLDDEIDF